MSESKTNRFVSSMATARRNDICNCGSGKKLKKCCNAPPTPGEYLKHDRIMDILRLPKYAKHYATARNMNIKTVIFHFGSLLKETA